MNKEFPDIELLLNDILQIVQNPSSRIDFTADAYKKNKGITSYLKKIQRTLTSRYFSKKEVDGFVKKANNLLLGYAQHRYSKELKLTNNETFDSLVTGLNFLGQELNNSTVTTHYLNDVFSSIGDIVLVVNKVGHILYVNSAGCNMLGYKESEIKDTQIRLILEKGFQLDDLLASQKTHLPVNFVTSSGGLLPVSLKISNFERLDNPMMGYVIIARDLSVVLKHQKEIEKKNRIILKANKELENAHQNLRIILDSVDVMVYIADIQTNEVLFLNDYGRNLFKEIPGKLSWESIHSAIDPPCPYQKKHITKDKEGPGNEPFQHEFKNKANGRWYECRDKIINWPDGRTVRLVIAADVTERKKAEEERVIKEQLEKKILLAEESLKFKQKFLANMSHEIRTPLAGIIGITEAMSKTQLNDQQAEFVKILQVSGESLRVLIDDVLDYSKIEAGKIRLNKNTFCLKTALKSVNDLFSNVIKKEIEMRLSISDSLPEYINADEFRISQVVRNFVSNAIKFTEKGSITLSASLVDEDQKDSTFDDFLIKIDVSDTGIGIRESKLNELFKPFVQLEDANQKKYAGTGLGLSICKEIATMHGGEIGVESKINHGSTFWFTFRTEKAAMPKPKSQKIDSERTKVQNLNILLVEDNLINQKVFSINLKYLGHTITCADNGAQALEKVKTGKFDLILMDVQMPVMDGVTATKLLKETYNVLPPIIGLSANAFEGDREKYMALGMDEYLTKPLDVDDFLDVIDKLF
jgi:PAS domain S-box-containing protein